MNRVMINAYQVGLVMKNGVYQKVLTAGTYWFWKNEKVLIYEKRGAFNAPVQLSILLQDEALAGMLNVIQVGDMEIALRYENGLLKEVLGTGEYAYWKGIVENTFTVCNIAEVEIPDSIDASILNHRLLTPYIRTVSVENNEKAMLFINGSFVRVLEPGIYNWWKNAIPIFVARADMRLLQLEINGQEILTRDKAALRLNAWAQYRINNIVQALLENKDFEKQLYVAVQIALREYVAAFSLDELMEKREAIGMALLELVSSKAEKLGVIVSNIGIRDIILPGDMKEIMNQVLIAEKRAQANIIMRREETASTRSLMNTAKLMEENTMLWKLKEMEYVEKIADKISTISINGNGVLIDQLKQLFVRS